MIATDEEEAMANTSSLHRTARNHTIKKVKDDVIDSNLAKEQKMKNNDANVSKNDWSSMALLLLLYTLQGIPMGLSASIPFILQGKVTYAEQATFSLVSWPFSLKLLWAPIVDSVYNPSFGRRKSWLIPVQLLCGFLMVFGSSAVSEYLAEHEDMTHAPNVVKLTIFFFTLFFLMATQDIAVDGWALTMLSEENVGHASTCNTVGQTLGYFIAYVGFLALNDPGTCNTYFRSAETQVEGQGMITLAGFMAFWGWIMLITTFGVWFFKSEEKDNEGLTVNNGESNLSVWETYGQLYSVLKLPSVMSLSVILLTIKMGFAAGEAVASLKLVEYGLPKEKLALMTPILIPFGIAVPIFVGRYISPTKPLAMLKIGYPARLLVTILYAVIVYITPMAMATNNSTLSNGYYFLILCSGALHEIASTMMFVPQMAFYAKISDPAIGGTYMTFLNTITNLGSKWPSSLSLVFVDYLTTRTCVISEKDVTLAESSRFCDSAVTKSLCTNAGGHCTIEQDGYFIETVLCFVIGIVWFVVFYKRLFQLQDLSMDHWRVQKSIKTS